jgi:hypothetical protein
MFAVADLAQAELARGFNFTQGVPLLKVPARRNAKGQPVGHTGQGSGYEDTTTVLFDLASDPAQFLRLTEAWEKRVETLRTEFEQDRDAKGRPLFISPDGVVTIDAKSRAHKSNSGGERLYKAPERFAEITHDQLHPRGSPYAEFLSKVEGGVTTRELLIYSSLRARPGEFNLMAYTSETANWVLEEVSNEPRMRPRRLSAEGAARLASETAEHHKLASDQLRRIDVLIASLGTTVANHLWIDTSIGDRVRPRLEAAQGDQGTLKARWDVLVEKVSQLPRAGQKGA